MELIKRLTFSIIFVFILNGICNACNLTGINIGGSKSEIEKYFGTTEINIVDPEVDISEVEESLKLQPKLFVQIQILVILFLKHIFSKIKLLVSVLKF